MPNLREPPEKTTGTLDVGHNEQFEVVVNIPHWIADENGVGHIVFSPRQARKFARLIWKHSHEALMAYNSMLARM